MPTSDTIVIFGGIALITTIVWFYFGRMYSGVPRATELVPTSGAHSVQPTGTVRASLTISGMTCAACVSRVEKAALRVPGVTDAAVNLLAGRGVVTYDPKHTNPTSISSAVSRIGYNTTPLIEFSQRRSGDNITEAGRKFWGSAILTIPLLYGSMGLELHLPGAAILSGGFLQLCFATAVVLYCGRTFFVLAAKATFHRTADMNTLIALGTGSAYLYSFYAIVLLGTNGKDQLYFESAGVIITLMLLGRYLEAGAREKTGASVEGLLALQPEAASVRRMGVEQKILLSQVMMGDRIVVRPGERVPTDGKVVQGSGLVDESMISGESLPASRTQGDSVIGGTLNQRGTFEYLAVGLGQDSALARIVRLVQEAQSSKAPIQRLADRVTAIFVPTVLSIAVATYILWYAVGHRPDLALTCFISTLIIACPCALGLATPTSLTVGIGRGAQLGIFIRDGEALERSASISIVAFDKTGTLTQGRPAVLDLITAARHGNDGWLRLLAAAESRSQHPIAEAIITEASRRGFNELPPVDSFDSRDGLGISATVESRSVLAGTADFLQGLGIDLTELKSHAEQLAADGNSIVYCSLDGKAAGVIAAADPIKDSSRETVAALQRMGLSVCLISGDLNAVAVAAGKQLGIARVSAGVKPEQKSNEVLRLMANGEVVAMVGDGVNDAPALAAADVGMALGTGTDIAQEAAGITLSGGNPTGVVTAIALARATVNNIKQNLAFAFGYNILGIPLAAGLIYALTGHGLLSPMVAGGAMALSSVSVITNSLRLRGFKAPLFPPPDIRT